MNGPVRQGMIAPSGIVQNTNMLAIGSQPFMQNSAHLGQPTLGQDPLGIPQPMNPANPAMAILSAPGPVPNPNQPRYPMHPNSMAQQPQQQRPMIIRQNQNSSQLNPGGNSTSGAPMHPQPGAMPFSVGMQPPIGTNNPVRRIQSQPHINNAPGVMTPTVTGGLAMAMGINQQSSMQGQMRPVPTQQQQQLRMQQQMLSMGGMSPGDVTMMRSQTANPVMHQSMSRAPSTQGQVMSSLSQPPPIGSIPHPGGMQPHHQPPFPNGGPIPSQHPPPQLSSSPRPQQTHNPGISMGTPGPSHTPLNRTRMTPDNSNAVSFMNYSGTQFPGARLQSNANAPGYPSFVPSSTPPMQMADIPQRSPSGMIHSQGGTPNRTGFMSTPAQQYEAGDMYSTSFSMGPPSAVPPRPSSHSNPHQPSPQQQQQQPPQQHQQHQSQQQQQTHHQSPPQSDQMTLHPQRPQSQPQAPPGRPPSQAGSTRTLATSNLSSGLTATGRLTQQQQSGPVLPQMLPIAPRPPAPLLSGASGPGPSSLGGVPPPSVAPLLSSAQPSADAPPSGLTMPITRPPLPSGGIGQGQGLIRLLQFSCVLANESKTKLQLSWWSDLIKEYFTPKAVMKLTLWKDNQRNEAKPFEIGVPILPRFFLVTTQSGVKSMTLSLDGARERSYAPGHAMVECVAAIWTYKYNNGYTVTLRGPLTARVIITASGPPGNHQATPAFTLKFEDFQFDANQHDKYIALDSIMGARMFESPRARHASTPTPGDTAQAQAQADEDRKWEEPRVLIERAAIPGEPVNAFGIPQATMRCLELAESVTAMADLIIFATNTTLGPIDALKKYASRIRESHGQHGQPIMNGIPPSNHIGSNPNMPNNANNSLSHPFQPYQPLSIVSTPSVTLYSSAPPAITNPPPPIPHSSMNSPQNTSSVNSPEKQLKSTPQQQAHTPSQASGPSSSPAISSGGTTNTPALANTSLKRKQTGDAASPTVGNPEQQPVKSRPRKRGRAGTQGAG